MALEKGDEFVDSPVLSGHLVEGYRIRADHLRPLVEHTRQLLDRSSSWPLTRVVRKVNLESDLLANRGIEEPMTEALGDAMRG